MLLLACLALGGCAFLRDAPMLAPGAFGMEEIGPALFVEPALTGAERDDLRRAIDAGRVQAQRLWGALRTAPIVVACATQACSTRFGSQGARAAAFGDRAIRLSHDGRSAALIAHEWSHAELYRRVGGWWTIGRIPRWFDEGVAVIVADEPRHSEANWQEILRRGLPVPRLDELTTRAEWIAAVRRYGETRTDDPDNRRIVYSAAAHELRRWLACAGADGVKALLDEVRDGGSFDAAYARLGGGCLDGRRS